MHIGTRVESGGLLQASCLVVAKVLNDAVGVLTRIAWWWSLCPRLRAEIIVILNVELKPSRRSRGGKEKVF